METKLNKGDAVLVAGYKKATVIRVQKNGVVVEHKVMGKTVRNLQKPELLKAI
jgi:hypothetical protein